MKQKKQLSLVGKYFIKYNNDKLIMCGVIVGMANNDICLVKATGSEGNEISFCPIKLQPIADMAEWEFYNDTEAMKEMYTANKEFNK